MNVIVKRRITQGDDEVFEGIDNVYNIVGMIRLWRDGVATNKYILIGDFPADAGENIRPAHRRLLNDRRDEVFAKAKVLLDDYKVGGKSFYMDINIPASIIDQYTG